MELEHVESETKGIFQLLDGSTRVGELTYVWAGKDMFIIDHTEVSETHEGQGLGKRLVDAAVGFARDKHVKILPLCPFAKKVFDRSPELRDVLS